MGVGYRHGLLAFLGVIAATELGLAPCAAAAADDSGDDAGELDMDDIEASAAEMAAEGDPRGYAHLGVAYLAGDGVPVDQDKALEFMTRAADMNDQGSQYNLGIIYMDGKMVPRDVKKAEQLWKKAADLGHGLSQFNLGLMYHGGDGVEKSFSKAMKYWKMASEQGSELASENVALMYEHGHGVRKNITKAVKFWTRALEQNSSKAEAKLAFYNFAGVGTGDRNKTRAAELLQASVNKGDGTAMYNLALMYLDGDGVPKNETKAEELLKQAMNKEHWNATVALGQLWYDGRGAIKQNVNMARAAWQVVAEKAPDSHPAKKTAAKLYDKAREKAVQELIDQEGTPFDMLASRGFKMEDL